MKSILLLLLGLLVSLAGTAQKGYGKRNQKNQCCMGSGCCYVSATVDQSSINPLTEKEKSTMMMLAQEDKLSHDTYYRFNETWNRQVFDHILQSESQHMDVMQSLETAYGIKDPSMKNKLGAFADNFFQHLYDSLIQEGSKSQVAALQAAAYIEDRDIFDLNTAISQTKEANLLTIYGNLRDASENHLRAYMRNLQAAGGEYHPQFLTEEQFKKITAASGGCMLQ